MASISWNCCFSLVFDVSLFEWIWNHRHFCFIFHLLFLYFFCKQRWAAAARPRWGMSPCRPHTPRHDAGSALKTLTRNLTRNYNQIICRLLQLKTSALLVWKNRVKMGKETSLKDQQDRSSRQWKELRLPPPPHHNNRTQHHSHHQKETTQTMHKIIRQKPKQMEPFPRMRPALMLQSQSFLSQKISPMSKQVFFP